MNPLDPLNSTNNVPDRQRELFEKFSHQANGYSAEDVAGAAINLLCNAIRQSHGLRAGAARAFDEAAARAKHLLLELHYHNDGKRKNVFPFTQHLEVGSPNWNKNTFHK